MYPQIMNSRCIKRGMTETRRGISSLFLHRTTEGIAHQETKRSREIVEREQGGTLSFSICGQGNLPGYMRGQNTDYDRLYYKMAAHMGQRTYCKLYTREEDVAEDVLEWLPKDGPTKPAEGSCEQIVYS